jgi:hypothetical protein
MKFRWIPLLLILTTISCTAVKYQSASFDAQTVAHQSVAVLPFEMVLDGELPEGLTSAQIARIEEDESLAFQRALYNALLSQSGAGAGRIRIDLQPVAETNRILRGCGLTVQQSWAMGAQDLAAILGVDAVIRTRVEKSRLLSDEASLGIDLGTRVLHEATQWRYAGFLPHDLDKTHDILADASLFNGDGGNLLWKVAVQRETDWRQPPDAVVEGVVRKLARKFPYRA